MEQQKDLDLSLLDESVEHLQNGSVGIFPCDTIWGIISIMDESAVQKIFSLKQRQIDQPLLLLIPNLDFLDMYVKHVHSKYFSLISRYWPGPLTLIFEKSDLVPDIVTAGYGTVGVRLPHFFPLNYVLNAIKQPIVSTSLNLSNQPYVKDLEDCPEAILNNIDFIYDDHVPPLQYESSIVNCSMENPVLIRKSESTPDIESFIRDSINVPG